MDPGNQGNRDVKDPNVGGVRAGCDRRRPRSASANADTTVPERLVMAASQSNQYEILAARVAQSQDPRVRTFAKTMIQDHIRLSQDLRNPAVASGLPTGTGMSSDQAMLLSGLQGRRGLDFDKTYARQQELAHAQAVAVVESFATADWIRTFERRRNPLCLLSGNT